jgi:hypothetical protein
MYRNDEDVPERVIEATERQLQAAVIGVLTGEIRATPASVRAVADYMGLCRESRGRMWRAA